MQVLIIKDQLIIRAANRQVNYEGLLMSVILVTARKPVS